MSLISAARPFVRAVRGVPGYRQVRRRIVLRLRRSNTARRVARGVYPDLVDPSQIQVLAEKHEAAEQRRRKAEIAALRERHTAQLDKVRSDALGAQEGRRRAIPPVSAGNLVAGVYLGERPLIVFDVRGMNEATSAETLEEIAVEQVLGCAFRPMFISDLEDASVWRRYGHLCEQVPPEAAWSGITGYQEYVAARLESVRADLGAGWILHVPDTGMTAGVRAFTQQCGR